MSLKTSDIRFKERIRIQIQDPIMRKAVANAQERIGTNRQKWLMNWDTGRNGVHELNRFVGMFWKILMLICINCPKRLLRMAGMYILPVPERMQPVTY